jgi:hypothetical protein
MATATLISPPRENPETTGRSLKKIESQLLSLARKASLLWQQMAALMIEVEEDRLWQGESKSFTAWLKAMADKVDLPESMLWRYLKAGRTYNALRDSPDPELAALPPLGEAPCKAVPESLELLDKISQVAPPEEAAELAKTTLAGESDREELREAWQDYKTVLPAADAELAETAPPEALATGKALAGAMLQALRRSRGVFVAAESLAARCLPGCQAVAMAQLTDDASSRRGARASWAARGARLAREKAPFAGAGSQGPRAG